MVEACPDCGAEYARKEYVKRHQRAKHTFSKPYECEGCGNAYGRSDLLQRHRKTCRKVHTDLPERPAKRQKTSPSVPPPDVNTASPPLPTSSSTLPPLPADAGGAGAMLQAHYYLAGAGTSGMPMGSLSASMALGAYDLPALSNGSSGSTDSSPSSFDAFAAPSITFANSASLNSSLTPPSAASSSSSKETATNPYQLPQSLDPTLAPTIGSDNPFNAWQWSMYAPLPSMSSAQRTQEELLASEALGQMPHSPPQFSAQQPLAPTTMGAFSGALTPTAELGTELFPSYWEKEQDPNKYESSSAAQQLASYFHRGGVGGITALDFGFSYEPSLVPAHVVTEAGNWGGYVDPNWDLDAEYFKLCYASTTNAPPLRKLREYIRLSSEATPWSLIHNPSSSVRKMAKHTSFALSVAGAAKADSSPTFVDAQLSKKRIYLLRSFWSDQPDPASQPPPKEADSVHRANWLWKQKYCVTQSMLLYQVIGMGHAEPQQVEMAKLYHPFLILMFRELRLLSKIREIEERDPEPWSASTSTALEAGWKRWLEVEEMRRVAATVLLADLRTVLAAAHEGAELAPAFTLAEWDVGLPVAEEVWATDNAADWSRKARTAGPTLSLKQALQILFASDLAAGVDEFPFYSQPALKPIDRLNGSAILILTKALELLEKQIKAALDATVPLSNFLADLDAESVTEGSKLKLLLRKTVAAQERLAHKSERASPPAAPPARDFMAEVEDKIMSQTGWVDWDAYDPDTGEAPALKSKPRPVVDDNLVRMAKDELKREFPGRVAGI